MVDYSVFFCIRDWLKETRPLKSYAFISLEISQVWDVLHHLCPRIELLLVLEEVAGPIFHVEVIEL